ncbi:MAG TPA: transposase [Candidatus Saccharicenans sp.]|nr:transposase [Candidatus Saccharicenans sp.]
MKEDRQLSPLWEEELRDRKVRLGIDESSFRGRDSVISVTKLKRRKWLAVMPDDPQEALRQFLIKIPGSIKRETEEVCVDIKPAFITTTEEELPEAEIVIDRFYMIHDANRQVDEARPIEQEATRKPIPKHLFLKAEERLTDKQRQGLDHYLTLYPSLREWYRAKEQLRRIYWAESEEKARELLFSLIRCQEASDDTAMND